MALTTGIVNGTDFNLYIGNDKIANAKSGSVTITHSPRRSHNKDTLGWEVGRAGALSWSINQDVEFAFDAAYGANALITAILARAELKITFKTASAQDYNLSGSMLLDSYEMTAGSEEDITFTISGSNTTKLTRTPGTP